jgi:hypothetical protein
MIDMFTFFTIRTVLVLFSTTISILIVMLMVNIITVEDVVIILNLSEDAANAFRHIVERMREVSDNILNILSQLVNKLFSWAGVDVDLSKIKVDVNSGSPANSSSPSPTSSTPSE